MTTVQQVSQVPQLVPLVRHGGPAAGVEQDFRLMPCLPRGCRVLSITSSAPPFARSGELVVVDPTQREPIDGGVYAVQWSEYGPRSITWVRWTKVFGHLAWWTRNPAGGLTDGPYTAERLRDAFLGRVIGKLAGPDGAAIRNLWGSGAHTVTDHPLVDLADLPETYVSPLTGRCMEPVYADGESLMVTARERPVVGDDVVLWRWPELVRDGEPQGFIKRLVACPAGPLARPRGSTLAPPIYVETLNPPKRYAVPVDELMAVHKCLGAHRA